MMRFTKHAKDRLAEYGISEEDVENMLKEPEKVFLDLKTGRFVAVKRWKDKHLVIVFESGDELMVITAFPTSKIHKVMRRVESGRWIEL